ncbi:MAG TPA: flagellar biosynthesis regulator FlaF [Syntrophorhabdaceae bacterium]|nr:flagellar biosynthesis regulator FlaF [Syntrophorhabdaceae bacterium]
MPGPGLNAYRKIQTTTTSGRELEASVLTNGAHLLKDCQLHWNEKDRFRRLDAALTFNQRLWTVFQSELIKEDNPLPVKLKADILSLSIFIDKRIVEIMQDPTPEKLNAVININLNLAAGLRGSPA